MPLFAPPCPAPRAISQPSVTPASSAHVCDMPPPHGACCVVPSTSIVPTGDVDGASSECWRSTSESVTRVSGGTRKSHLWRSTASRSVCTTGSLLVAVFVALTCQIHANAPNEEATHLRHAAPAAGSVPLRGLWATVATEEAPANRGDDAYNDDRCVWRARRPLLSPRLAAVINTAACNHRRRGVGGCRVCVGSTGLCAVSALCSFRATRPCCAVVTDAQRGLHRHVDAAIVGRLGLFCIHTLLMWTCVDAAAVPGHACRAGGRRACGGGAVVTIAMVVKTGRR